MKKAASKKIVRTEILARFIHIVIPTEVSPAPRVQAVAENGRLVTTKCSAEIHRRVRGERKAGSVNQYHMGLRQLTHVKFRAHYDEAGAIQGLDIIPNRMFTSGAAPSAAGKATKSGFEVHWDEELQGFDVWTEHPDTGDKQRIAYAGLSETALCDILDDLRAYAWGTRKQVTLGNHRIDKLEDNGFRVRPVGEVKYTT